MRDPPELRVSEFFLYLAEPRGDDTVLGQLVSVQQFGAAPGTGNRCLLELQSPREDEEEAEFHRSPSEDWQVTMSQTPPTTMPRENTLLSRILIAIDGSEHSARALRYAGTLLRDTRDVQITLFHVLKPMPRGLLEHGGSEDPAEEIRLAKKLQEDQENWVRTESVFESPILVTALELFGKTGFPLDRVTLKFGHEDDIAHTILDEARTGGYGTIVMSRHASHAIKRFFGGSITDQLLRDASGFTLWIVE